MVKVGGEETVVGCADITSVGARGKLGSGSGIEVGLEGLQRSHR